MLLEKSSASSTVPSPEYTVGHDPKIATARTMLPAKVPIVASVLTSNVGATLTLVRKVSIPSTSESATRCTMASPEFRPYLVPRPTSASEVTVTPFG